MSKILTFLTNLGKTFTALAPAFKAAITVAVLVVLYFAFAASHGPSNVEKFNTKYGIYQKSVDSTVKFVKDSMAKQVVIHQQIASTALAKADQEQTYIVKLIKTTVSRDSVVKLKREIDSLKKATTDSVILARTVIPKQDTVIAVQDTMLTKKDSTIVDYANQVGFFHIAVTQKDSTIGIQKVSIDTLTNKLTNLPKAPKPDKFLGFIPMPSRKLSGAVGFLLGVVATIEATIHIK
jgi:ribosomal protein L17